MNRLHLAVALVMLGSGTLSAQRTMPGQIALSLRGSVFRTSAGLDLGLAQGLPFGYCSLSVGIDDRRSALSNGESLRYDDITLTPSVMARLASTRSRSLCLYAGAGVLIGCEVCDPMSSLDPNVETGVEGRAFIWGAEPRLELEWFPLRRTALVIDMSAPVTSSRLKAARARVGLGFRCYL